MNKINKNYIEGLFDCPINKIIRDLVGNEIKSEAVDNLQYYADIVEEETGKKANKKNINDLMTEVELQNDIENLAYNTGYIDGMNRVLHLLKIK